MSGLPANELLADRELMTTLDGPDLIQRARGWRKKIAIERRA
jgi:hypothetical protein